MLVIEQLLFICSQLALLWEHNNNKDEACAKTTERFNEFTTAINRKCSPTD